MTEDYRPDPDALLARIQREENLKKTGRLYILLGMCAGVGKTYAMSLLARQRQGDGLNVLVGVVETHGRKETADLATSQAACGRGKSPSGGGKSRRMRYSA